MSPLVKSELNMHPRIGLKGWKNGETRKYKFLDNGVDYTHPEYGLSYVYEVLDLVSNDVYSIFIRPNSPLAIGVQQVFTDKLTKLTNISVEITKTTGKDQKDTRYVCKVI